jgi:hypothetical protein
MLYLYPPLSLEAYAIRIPHPPLRLEEGIRIEVYVYLSLEAYAAYVYLSLEAYAIRIPSSQPRGVC